MLKKQINIFRGLEEEETQSPKYNHPIQWSQLDEIKNDKLPWMIDTMRNLSINILLHAVFL